MLKAKHKLTKTELKEKGLLKLIERWEQLCLDGHSYEYDDNINCAIRLYKNMETSRNSEGGFEFHFKETDWYYDDLDDKLPVLCILSGILSYYDFRSYYDFIPYFAIDSYIEKTATVRQFENYKVLLLGIKTIVDMEHKTELTKQYNELAAKLKMEALYEFNLDFSFAINKMESFFDLLQKARKDAAEEKLRELIPLPNFSITGPIHNSGTLTGNVINPQYNK